MSKAYSVFKVGNHDIGWLDSDFQSRYGDVEVVEANLPEIPEFKKLGKTMSGAEIQTELHPTDCSLEHVLAFLKNPPEESKDGYWNIFFVGSFVVALRWHPGYRVWSLHAWARDRGWSSYGRVFSPAFDSVELSSGPSDSLTLIAQIEKIEQELKKLKGMIV